MSCKETYVRFVLPGSDPDEVKVNVKFEPKSGGGFYVLLDSLYVLSLDKLGIRRIQAVSSLKDKGIAIESDMIALVN